MRSQFVGSLNVVDAVRSGFPTGIYDVNSRNLHLQ